RFILMQPEKMTAPLLANPAGAFTVSSAQSAWVDMGTYTDPGATQHLFLNGHTGLVAHCCLWHDDGPTADANGNDVYDIKLFVTCNNPGPHTTGTQFFVTPVHIVVGNPKTPT